MFHRVLSLSFLLALAPIAACTDVPGAPTDEPSTTIAARVLDCVELGYGFDRAHRICVLTRDERVELQVTPALTCPRIHVRNACGDQCCDLDEANLHGASFCARDCIVGTVGLLDAEGVSKAAIQISGATVGTADSTAITVTTRR